MEGDPFKKADGPCLMNDTLATGPTRSQAVAEVKSTRCPQGVSKQRWRSIQKLLRVIAKHYPKAMPSVATLAAEMGCSVRMAQYRIQWAVEAGVLVVECDAGMGRNRFQTTNRYHIASLQTDAPGARSGEDIAYKGSPSENYSSSMSSPPQSNERPHFVRPVAAATKEPPEDRSRQVELVASVEPEPEVWDRDVEVEKINEFGRQERKVIPKPPGNTPTRFLVRYFAGEWKRFVGTHTMYAQHRPFDSRGEAGKYIQDTFLAPAAGVVYTEAQVMVIMDEWFLGLAELRNRIKPGQSAWRRFTATWQPPGGVSQQPSLEGDWWKK